VNGEENGQASILRDLLKLRSTYRYQRYRVDVLGFAVAWIIVLLFIAFYCWMATWQ
jgi:hypothetical protein